MIFAILQILTSPFQQASLMSQITLKNTLCSQHAQVVSQVCCSNSCQLQNSGCQKCTENHKQHLDKIMPLQKFYTAVLVNIQDQNKRDVSAMRYNDLLISNLEKYRRNYDEKQKENLQLLMKMLEEQKNEIVSTLKAVQKNQLEKNKKYFDRLNKKKMIMMRIKFASQKGLEQFNKRYNIFKKHYKSNQQEKNSRETSAINITGSLTQALKKFIKLKVSKKDGMKISLGQINTPGIPPPSPRKKRTHNNTTAALKIQLNPS